MAYDRYDSRRGPRDPSRNPDDRYRREAGDRGRDERGFFDRAGDEIASWFGDDEAERRRRQDDRMGGRDSDFEPGRDREPGPSFAREQDRGRFGSDRDDDRGFRSSRDREPWGAGDRGGDRGGERERGYRPVTGDYGRSEDLLASGGYGRGEGEDFPDRGRFDRETGGRARFGGSSDRSQSNDPHYQAWRQRQIEDLDRDYDEYRREHQSKFENDFGSWRSNRQTKRQMLGQVREHMEVAGSDDEPVGTIDRVAGDRIILTKSDEAAGGAHHSLSCTDIDRVEGERVILGCTADQARNRWRDESRDRALFEREDQGEAGPHALDRSFSGTYR